MDSPFLEYYEMSKVICLYVLGTKGNKIGTIEPLNYV